MPAYSTFGSDSEMARAPTLPVAKYPSEMLAQKRPPSLVCHTPPAQLPK